MKITSKSRSVEASKVSNKNDAIQYVRCAIDALGASAKQGDKTSKEAIANLSVVLFDIQDN